MVARLEIDYTGYMTFDRRKVRAAMRKGAQALRRQSKQLGGKRSGGGVSYPGRTGTASAPGEPPVRYTSTLWRSIYARASRRGYAIVGGTLVPHAHIMEMGTRYLAARPLMPTSLGNVRDQIVGLLRGAIGEGLRAIDGSPGNAPDRVERG